MQAAAAGLALTVLAACGTAGPSGGTEPEYSPAPVPGADVLPEADTSGLLLPGQHQGAHVVTTHWQAAPSELDGVLLGNGEVDGLLRYSAVDAHGRVLWTADRPLSCTGHTLTRDADGRPLAVLTDIDTAGSSLSLSATAYDLATGDQRWGPVPLPGPYVGPGLVFAEPPAGYLGEPGPRTVLDPSTGEVLLAEEDAPGTHVIGEYTGTVVTVTDGAAVAGSAGEQLWHTDLTDLLATGATDDAHPAPGVRAAPGTTLVTHGEDSALLDLADGAVLATDVRQAARDAGSGMLVVLGSTGLRGLGTDGGELWTEEVGAGTEVTAVGGVLAYLRDPGAVRVRNVATGAVAQGWDPGAEGQPVLPVHLSPTGAAVLEGDRLLLVTVDPAPGTGTGGNAIG